MESQTKHQTSCGQLFIVATPIGNLADITFRAVETLKTVHAIAAEDTRLSRKLLQHYGIRTPMIALHEHNEVSRSKTLLKRLQNGEDIALISDAGTPLISDPGYRLVLRLRQAGIRVTPIPGACSILAALSAAGLPADHFRFAGFLPRSGKARSVELKHIAASDETTVLLESPRRLQATLRDFEILLDEKREVAIARELTKLYEEFVSGSVAKVIGHFEQHAPRGEIVLIIGPASEEVIALTDQDILNYLADESMRSLPPSTRARTVAKMLNVPKSRVYMLMVSDEYV
jgi:16S rRNA (cytidine1402-2'-O)-methyltransferase